MLQRFLAILIVSCWSGLAFAQDTSDTADAAAPPPESVDVALTALRAVLADPQATEALLDRLEGPQKAASEDASGTTDAADVTLAQTLAERSADIFDALQSRADLLSLYLTNLRGLDDILALEGVAATDLFEVLATIGATLGIYFVLHRLSRRFLKARSLPVGAGFRRAVKRASASAALRLGSVVVAWIAGYGLAAFVIGGTASGPSAAQSLYLNAFLAFGAFRTVLAIAFTPDADAQPGLSRLAPRGQEILYRQLRTVGFLVTQSALFFVPLVQLWFGGTAGRSALTVLATLTLLVSLRAVYVGVKVMRLSRGHLGTSKQKSATSDALEKWASRIWGLVWPPAVVFYAIYAWSIAVLRPYDFAESIVGGTLYTIAAIALAFVGVRVIEMSSSQHAPLTASIIRALPQYGHRLGRSVILLGWSAGVALIFGAGLLVSFGWEFFDVSAWLADPVTQQVLWGIASAVLIALAASLVWVAVAGWIDYQLGKVLASGTGTARRRTLLTLFRSAFAILLAALTGMIVLAQLGVNIGPLLAGAGVVGLAVGFGAQKLVQDVITGAFIQIENAMNEGDVVDIAGVAGVAEKISIRSVRVRALDGTVHVIPFSSVDLVSNLTRDYGYHVAEVGAAYKEEVSDVKAAMEEAFLRLKELHKDALLAPLEMHGVIELGDSSVVVRARIKTKPGQQWAIGRTYTELLKKVMDEHKIEIPFPHRQIVLPRELPEAAAKLIAAE